VKRAKSAPDPRPSRFEAMTWTPKSKLLTATWVLWALSLAVAPLLAIAFHTFIKPDETDDFGMGPFLSGVILGAILSGLFGIAALSTHVALRKTYPSSKSWPVRAFEKAVLAAPPALILSFAVQFMGGNPIVSAGFYLFSAATVLLLLR